MHQYMNKPYYLLRLAMTGSRNSRWQSSKPEVPIFQLVEELETRFQITTGNSVAPLHANMCTSGDMTTSGLAETLLDLSLPVRSDSILGITIRLLDPENIGLAVGIALLLCVQLEFPHEKEITLFTNKNGTPSEFSTVVPVVS